MTVKRNIIKKEEKVVSGMIINAEQLDQTETKIVDESGLATNLGKAIVMERE